MDWVNPYRLWQAMVYNNVDGFDKHAFNCFDCFSFLHYANTYNIVIASLTTDSAPWIEQTTNSVLATYADQSRDCDKIANDIWSNLCVKGVHVVVRYVDLWNDNDFDDRYSMTVGEKKTITVWAEQGFCDKDVSNQSFYSNILAGAELKFLQ